MQNLLKPYIDNSVAAIKDDLGTAAAKDYTTTVSANNADLVTSGAVRSAVGVITSKTLAASATSVEFDVPTSGNNVIDFFASDGSNYTAIDLSVSGKATLTYDAVASARTISCRIAQA